MAYPRVLATLVYAIRDDEVLLHRRVKDPNKGLWVAPGGKLDPTESPTECAVREMREETGLELEDPALRGVMVEVSPRPDYQWVTFIYAATRWTGELAPAAGIGDFRWVRAPDPAGRPGLLRARDAPGGSAVPHQVHVRRRAAHRAHGRRL